MVSSESSMDENITVGCGCAACAHAAQNGTSSNNNASLDAPTTNGPDQLLSGSVWNNDGNGVTLYYRFSTSIPNYYNSGDTEYSGYKNFSTEQQEVAEKALEQIESFTNITFVETTSEAQSQLNFAQSYLDSGVGAWAYYPSFNLKGGDVWTNRTYVDETGLNEGGYDFFTILHEIGHALGLQHTFDGGLNGEQNTEKYSVMAYDWSTWGGTYAETYQLYDIYALQQLYGTNTTYNSGNDTYVLRSGDAYTIYDSGGIDTFDASHINSNVTLNLEAGTFSSVGQTENIAIAYGVTIENATGGSGNDTIYGNDANNVLLGGAGNDSFFGGLGDDTIDGEAGTNSVTYSYSISQFTFSFIDSLTIALSHISEFFTDTITNIESFIFTDITHSFAELYGFYGGNIVNAEVGDTTTNGTAEVDIITGNNLSEILKGLDGNDTIHGENGADSIYGNAGNDTIYGGGWSDIIFGDGKTSTANDGDDTIYAESGNDRVNGRGGDDYIDGGTGHDVLYGHEGSDEIVGGAGSDTIFGDYQNEDGSSFADILSGGDGRDKITGGGGNDTLNGDAGNDLLKGGTGNDLLNGGAGNDRIEGGADNDTIIGGTGFDVLFGQGGSDIFGFTSISLDTIKDFTLNGAEQDSLNITDILVGYDSATDDINDFVVLDYKNASQTNLYINANGSGSWAKAATIQGSNFSGTTVDDLVSSGQLITDVTLL